MMVGILLVCVRVGAIELLIWKLESGERGGIWEVREEDGRDSLTAYILLCALCG